MKTIIKIPLFVEIETDEGMDRKVISNGVRDYFIPEFYRTLKSKDLLSWMYSSELKKLSSTIGKNARFKILTQADIFFQQKPVVVDKKPWE